MNRKHSNRKLGHESLEKRELFAGDLTAYVGIDGTLNISEKSGQAGQANSFEISQGLSVNSIKLTGKINATGSTTLIDGSLSKVFFVPLGNISVQTGNGNDWVHVKNVQLNRLSVNTGAGMDRLWMDNAKTKGSVTANMGTEADYVGIVGSTIGNDATDNLKVDLGAGRDEFFLKGYTAPAEIKGDLHIHAVSAETEADVDKITIDLAKVGGTLFARTGGGDDTINMRRVIVGDDLILSAGADRDTAVLSEIQVLDDFWADVGSGNDTLEVDDVAADVFQVLGGDGFDTLIRRRNGQVRVNMTPVSFETIR